MSRVLFNRITEEQREQHEEAVVSYDDLKASVDQYYNENITHRDQIDKLVDASMSSLNIISTTISEFYKVKAFDFSALLSAVKSLRAHVVKQEEASNAWMKSSTNMAWNLGSRMSGVELSQTALKREISSLTKDTSEIKSLLKGENANTTATEEPPSHTEGETEGPRLSILISSIPSTIIPSAQAQPITSIIIHPKSSQATLKIDKGKGIATKSDDDPSKKLVKASSIVRPDPDEQVRVEFMINGKVVYLTEQEIQDYWDKEEQIKKAEEESRLLIMTKPKKAQDTKHVVLKRQHTKRVIKSLDLRKQKYDSYMWTVSSRLKPEPITNIKIHPKTKPVVIKVYRGTDGRNVEVHEPFLFGAFGISKLDELREIIPKKKNAVVKEFMNSLSRRYKRLKKIPEELGIHSALPAPAPEHASS
ncbi:hypothetical protein Tco_0638376 [Tanacetum coccineum]